MTSCETGSSVATAKLGSPNLKSYDYSYVNTPYGTLSVSNLLMSKAFKSATFNGGFFLVVLRLTRT